MKPTLSLLCLLAALGPTGAGAVVDAGGVVDAYFDAYNTMDLDGMLATYAPDAVFIDVAQRHRYEGGDELRKLFGGLLALHSEMGVEVRRWVASEELVVVDYVYRGRLSGEALRAATGKETCRDTDYEIPVTSWFEVRDGRIHRHTDYIDLKTLDEVRAAASGSEPVAAATP